MRGRIRIRTQSFLTLGQAPRSLRYSVYCGEMSAPFAGIWLGLQMNLLNGQLERRDKVRGKSELENGIQKLHGGFGRISEVTEVNNQ